MCVCVRGSEHLPQFLDVLQVANQDLVVDGRPQAAGLKEVDTVQVRYVHPPGGRERGGEGERGGRERWSGVPYLKNSQ